jgi:hypothetical protein
MKISKILALSLGVLVLSVASFAFAEDRVETKVKNAAEDTSTDVKKSVRKAKRGVRKALGTDTKAKEAKDGVEDRKDELNSTVNKIQNKADE